MSATVLSPQDMASDKSGEALPSTSLRSSADQAPTMSMNKAIVRLHLKLCDSCNRSKGRGEDGKYNVMCYFTFTDLGRPL